MGVSFDETFDADQEQPRGETIPEGIYKAIIVASERKKTKAGNNSFLELTWQILNGPHAGNQLKSRLNLWNTTEIAVKIARQELGEIVRAVGKTKVGDSQQLHNLPCDLSVVVDPPTADGKIYNSIKRYSKPGSAATPEAEKATSDAPGWG